MRLQSVIDIPNWGKPIQHDHQLLLMGSCFSGNIGERLSYHGFKTVVNPFGVIYNPVSIGKLVGRALRQEAFSEEDLYPTEDGSLCFDAHSSLTGKDIPSTLSNLNHALQELCESLKEAQHILITLGSARVYRRLTSGSHDQAGENKVSQSEKNIVANCHKQPASHFERQLLSTGAIRTVLGRIVKDIHNENPKAQIVFTVSPVRHLRDGFVENAQSKARLHDAVQQVVAETKSLYFPSYELVMDEMRDYRFYGRDLVHLNELGVEYMWYRFRESAISHDTETTTLMKSVDSYRKFAAHKPFANEEEHSESVTKKRKQLLERYPHLSI